MPKSFSCARAQHTEARQSTSKGIFKKKEHQGNTKKSQVPILDVFLEDWDFHQKKLDFGNANLVIAVPDDWIDVQTIADLEEVSFDIRSKLHGDLILMKKHTQSNVLCMWLG